MRRYLIAIIAVLFLFALAGTTYAVDKYTFIHDVSVDTAKTNAVPVPNWTKYVGVMIPNVTAGAVGIEIYESGSTAYQDVAASALLASADTNWVPVIDISDGQDAVALASGQDPGYIDITPFLGAVRNVWVRFTLGVQAADTTWYLYVKD